MSWSHSETVLVTDYGGYTPYPCLDHITDLRLKSIANGGECQTSYDVAYYDALTGALLEFEIEKHDFGTGEISAWVGCSHLQGSFVRKWGDPSIVSSLENKTTLWSNYYVTPVVTPGPTLSATGFVFHCNDNAATYNVVNSVPLSANTCAFRTIGVPVPTFTNVVTTDSRFGKGLTFTGGSGNHGLVVSPDVLDFFGNPIIFPFGNDNQAVTIEIGFKITSAIGSDFALTNNVYFALLGYYLGIRPNGHLLLQSSGGAPKSVEGTTVLVSGTNYYVTAIIDHGVGSIYLGHTLEATGVLDKPYAESNNQVFSGFYPNSGYWTGIIDEWRMVLAVVPQRSIPVVPPPPPNPTSGIYYIKIDKTHDTLYTDVATGATEDFEIP